MDPHWLDGLVGGLSIGAAAALLLLGNGGIAGATGTLRGFLKLDFGERWLERAGFLAALIAVPVLYADIVGAPTLEAPFGVATMAVGGLIVGVGAGFANGSISGHGVCGVARLSKRSVVATVTFLLTTGVTVFVVRHVVGA